MGLCEAPPHSNSCAGQQPWLGCFTHGVACLSDLPPTAACRAATFGLPSKLLADGRVPAQLNGGLDQINSAYWIVIVAAGIFVESKSLDSMFGKKTLDYSPGMLGYDLFGYDSPSMRKAEIVNGRVAMVAITVFALEEAIFQAPVVRETSIFFQPLWTTLGF